MTRDYSPRPAGTASDRRSFLRTVSAATAGAALVGTGASTAIAQDGDDGDDGLLDEGWKGLIFADNFHPGARFVFVSGVVEWTPSYGDVRDSWFADYNTRMIRWLNTDEVVPLYLAEEADVGDYDSDLGFVTDADDDPEQPQVFEMSQEWSPFSDNPRLVTLNVNPVDEDDEDAILDTDDWWQAGEDDGAAGNGTDAGNATADGNATAGDDQSSLLGW